MKQNSATKTSLLVVLWAKSITVDYITAENKLQSTSKLFIQHVFFSLSQTTTQILSKIRNATDTDYVHYLLGIRNEKEEVYISSELSSSERIISVREWHS